MPTKRTASFWGFLLACAISGAVLDFLFNGVLKIVWIIVYGPAYIAACKVLTTQLERLKRPELNRLGVIALMGGALVCHLASVGRRREVTYPMVRISDDPVTLHSSDWPQVLAVSSEPLKQLLANRSKAEEVPVVLQAVMDYGCYRSIKVTTVAGVDVQSDPAASWTWRMENRAPMPTDIGPGSEDLQLPWCRIKFYRGTK